MTALIKTAKNHFYNREYSDALKIFIEINDLYSAGLCSLLLKEENKAKEFWQKSAKYSPAALWGLSVLDLIHYKMPKMKPAFFQTRAQLEIYLNLFIENGLIEWAQNLVNMYDILYQSNPESYKFIARALYSNGYFDLAIEFCKKNLSLFPYDPEALLIMSQCYYLVGNMGEALDCTNRINRMIYGYFPAIAFQKILKEEIEKKRNSKK